MGMPKHNIVTMLALGVFAAGTPIVPAGEDQTLRWNEAAQSNVLNRPELAKRGEVLPTWKIKQMVWPALEELVKARVEVSGELRDECVTWLAKFVSAKQLPADIKEHLVAMKGWGLVKAESEQKRLCDVFIVRFRKAGYTVHLQESPANVVVTIVQEAPAPDADMDHKNLVFRTAAWFLKEELQPNPESKWLRVFKEEKGGLELTTVRWWIDSVIVEGPGNRTGYDGSKTAKLGTWNVVSETDGRYVRFIIHKNIPGPVGPDVYAKRFDAPR
jgi:hypothetical protein